MRQRLAVRKLAREAGANGEVTLIGHDVPGRGFVPLGVDPAAVPEQPVFVGPSLGAPTSP